MVKQWLHRSNGKISAVTIDIEKGVVVKEFILRGSKQHQSFLVQVLLMIARVQAVPRSACPFFVQSCTCFDIVNSTGPP